MKSYLVHELKALKVFTISSDKSDRKSNIDKFFLEILFVSSFTTRSARFSEFDSRNVTLFQIKVFVRNIKETAPAKYFIKVTAALVLRN